MEAVCNRVLILNRGNIVAEGTPDKIRDEIREDDRYTVEIMGNADISSLEMLPSVLGIVSEERKGDRTVIKIAARKQSDAGAEIFDWAVRGGLRLSAIVPEQTSLEDIFRILTKKKAGV